ncbi:MAG: anti-sigma factor antagonist [Nitrospirae bacterium]|nr:MAG: anti-sigma factor antagonist [Nitrospirota bacterium]
MSCSKRRSVPVLSRALFVREHGARMSTVDVDRERRRIILRGGVTIFKVADLHEALLALSRNDAPIDVDLSAVDHLDSAAIQVLLVAVRSAPVTVCGLSLSVRKRCRMIGLETL